MTESFDALGLRRNRPPKYSATWKRIFCQRMGPGSWVAVLNAIEYRRDPATPHSGAFSEEFPLFADEPPLRKGAAFRQRPGETCGTWTLLPYTELFHQHTGRTFQEGLDRPEAWTGLGGGERMFITDCRFSNCGCIKSRFVFLCNGLQKAASFDIYRAGRTVYCEASLVTSDD